MSARIEFFDTLDPVAFALALILAPIFTGVLFFWALLIPVFAVAFGAVPYLIFGTPVLLWMVSRYPPEAKTFAVGGLLALAFFALCILVLSELNAPLLPREPGFIAFLICWGIPFSMGWFAAFAILYRRFYRPLVL